MTSLIASLTDTLIRTLDRLLSFFSDTRATYASEVAAACNFEHSNGPYGENLAAGESSECRLKSNERTKLTISVLSVQFSCSNRSYSMTLESFRKWKFHRRRRCRQLVR